MQPKNAIRFMLFGLGFLSIGTQIYLMREFLVVGNGNELIFGVVLALWMLLTGAGAWLGRFSHFLSGKSGLTLALMIVAGLLPTLMILNLDLAKAMMVPHGSMSGIWMIVAAATLVPLPFCLLNGFLFSFLSVLSAGNTLAEAYSWESMGSMASGALVNLVFLWMFDPWQSLLFLTAGYLIMVLVFAFNMERRNHFYLGLFFAAIILMGLLFVDFRTFSESVLYRDQQVVSNLSTPYGQVVVTKNQDQFNFYENGLLLFSGGNEISNEENVHPAMVQRDHPRSVLLISGGYSGTLDEILKYDPDLIDYVEMNPSLILIGSKFTSQLDHPAVRVKETDARKFVRATQQSYDMAMVNLPAPFTLQLNRYYTLEFLTEIKKKLSPGGVVAYSLPTGSDYVSEEAGRLNSILFQTLKHRFSHVLIIPLQRNYFLASDSALDIDIPALVQQRGIETVYVNQYYVDVRQLRERSAYVAKNIDSTYSYCQVSTTLRGSPTLTGCPNRDFYPVATFYQNLWWLGYFTVSPFWILFGFLVILVLLLAGLNSVSAGLFTGGFTLASTEIILIFSLQVIWGYVFQAIGVIIMVFMTGLAAGAASGMPFFRIKHSRAFIILQTTLALYCIGLPFLLLRLSSGKHDDIWVQMILGVCAFQVAFMVGIEYRVATLLARSSPRNAVARLYSADLFGSAMGAFATAAMLFPFFGIVYTGFFLAVLNIFSAMIFFIQHRKLVSFLCKSG